MVKQAEGIERLNALGVTLDKISSETTSLVDEVKALKDAAEAQGDLSPEFVAALEAVEGRAKSIDEKVTDIAPGGETGGGEVEVPVGGEG